MNDIATGIVKAMELKARNKELAERLADAEAVVAAFKAAVDGDSDIWNHAPDAARQLEAYMKKWGGSP